MALTKIKPSGLDQTLNYSANTVTANSVVAGGVDLFVFANAAFTTANNSSDSWVRGQANAAFERANNSLNVQSGGTITGNVNIGGNFLPSANITYNLGSPTYRWKDLYLSGNTIDLAGAQIKSDPNTGGFVFVPTPNANTPNPTALFISSTGTLTTVQTTGGEISGANLTLAAANTANSVPVDASINLAFAQANASFIQANAAFNAANNASDSWVRNQANLAFGTANSGSSYANSAFTKANNALPLTGGTISGSLEVTENFSVTGNLTILGTTTSINTSSFVVNDSLLVLGLGNYTSDLLDIGFASHYNDGSNAHAGIIRDASTKQWMFFEGYVPEITANNNVIVTDPTFRYSNVIVRNLTGNVFANNITVNGYDLFTYATNAYTQANSAFTAANNATDTWVRNQANLAFSTANSGSAYANAAFAKANAAFNAANTSGGGSSVDTYISLSMIGLITPPYSGSSRFYPPRNMTLNTVYSNLSTASNSGDFTFIIKKNGTSIGNTFTITQNQTVMTAANVNVSLTTTDYLTLDVTGAIATDLFVRIKYVNT